VNHTTCPPGPRGLRSGRLYLTLCADKLGYLTRLAREYGDVAHVGSRDVVLLSHPDHVQEVLVNDPRGFAKPDVKVKRLLGEGLLTSNGDFHLRQRRLMQPAFRRERLAGYAAVMAGEAARACDRWSEGAPLDVPREMMRLTQAVVARALFQEDVAGADADAVGDALTEALEANPLATRCPALRLFRRVLPGFRDFYGARDRLDAIVYRMIRERQAAGRDRGSLLDALLRLSDESGGMSDRQVRDEVLTLFLAGHETTASALSWTWYLLARHPEVEARLHAEVDAVLAGREPTAADLPRLGYTEQVFRETLRLYPSVALLVPRRSLAEKVLGGYRFPAGTYFLLSPFITQRDPRFFPDPLRFDPDRWTPQFRQALPRFAYFPFGGGNRMCIGDQFAWMEGVLVLAAVVGRWRLELEPGHPPVEPHLAATLRPKPTIRLTPRRRHPCPA
jgi:cytochrome P450